MTSMYPPPMKARTVERSENVCLIEIEHDPRQSYARAVDPRAMKHARQTLRGRGWTLIYADYAGEITDNRCTAVYRFEQR